MGLVIYSNGIVEEMNPKGDTFSEEELIQSFSEYDFIRTHRLLEIPNTWCIWAEMDNPKDIEYNKIAAETVDEEVFSHIIFVHDSELNLDWKVTDMILKPYSTFLEETGNFITEIMEDISLKTQNDYENNSNSSMIFLTAMGHTADKRVLFSFNPDEQSDTFYIDGGWDKFASKIYEYLIVNFDKEPVQKGKPFVIFSDTKTIVIIEEKYVDNVIDNILRRFELAEDYEKCSIMANIKKVWESRFNSPEKIIDSSIGDKRKPGRPKGSKNKDKK